MIEPGDIISYLEMCTEEGVSLQRGMNFRLGGSYSVILMSTRPNAPYDDAIEEDGRVLVYEGHDIPRRQGGPDPKSVDQPQYNSSGTPTQNGLFFAAAQEHRNGDHTELVKVYEKIRNGIWTFNGFFRLVNAWQESNDGRQVFKFKLNLIEAIGDDIDRAPADLEHTRMIPSSVKLAVWQRDEGRCVECGATDNLHFDHIIPYSKGGSSLVAENIQLLCARHNLAKRDKIQ